MVVSYDGTGFHGWQKQPGQRTVQGVLEDAVHRVIADDTVAVAGAGRTDAGVHARGQVASFSAATRLPATALPPLLGRCLPSDVRVRAATEVPDGFHARHSARGRRYAYRLLREDDLLRARTAWWPGRPVDPDALARATSALECEADFSAFQSSGSPASPRCRVSRATWSCCGPVVRFDVVADHFLYHMVRTMVGTALAVARSDDPRGAMRAVLDSRDRARAGVVAPAHGLTLEEVFYDGTSEPAPAARGRRATARGAAR